MKIGDFLYTIFNAKNILDNGINKYKYNLLYIKSNNNIVHKTYIK